MYTRVTGAAVVFGAILTAIASAPVWANSVQNPTFTRDVAPILHENCVSCHQPEQIGPMALRTYDEVRPWAKSIAQYVGERKMPPWHADPGYGPFVNERSLTEDQIATIVRWVEQGAKRGKPSDLPQIPEPAPEGWLKGEPDYEIAFDEVSVPAEGPDQFHDLIARTDLPEDKWIKSVEIRPGDRKVVHHVILWQEGNVNRGGTPQGWIGAWAAGALPFEFPEGTGRQLKKGAAIIGDMHYHPSGTAATDQTRVGFHFAKDEDVEKELINLWVINTDFEIPAGDPNYEAHATYTFPQDGKIFSLAPHMHYRGKDFKYTLTYPDGEQEELLKVSKYDFNWQTFYEFEEPVPVPKGTRVDCVAHWDNSADNPANPDPTKTVRFGNESYDEMMIGFIDWAVDEGVRPKEQPSPVLAKLEELAAADPGQVYKAFIPQVSALHVPKEGEGGWYIDIGGFVGKARVYDIVWEGDSFTAKVAIPGEGISDLSGTVKASEDLVQLTMKNANGQEGNLQGTIVR